MRCLEVGLQRFFDLARQRLGCLNPARGPFKAITRLRTWDRVKREPQSQCHIHCHFQGLLPIERGVVIFTQSKPRIPASVASGVSLADLADYNYNGQEDAGDTIGYISGTRRVPA